MIAIVDYGLGNLMSVLNMFKRIGCSAQISADPAVIRQSSKLVLPGVGHFRHAIAKLQTCPFFEVLNTRVLNDKVPILGICLGAQLMGKHSEEGNVSGLGWLPMRTRAFDPARMSPNQRVPHMGWTETYLKENCRLTRGLEQPSRFYYVHSFHFDCETPRIELCRAKHGYEFVSGVASENIMGVQFHPEKSHKFGMKILRNFAEIE